MKYLDRAKQWLRQKLRDPEMPYVQAPPWVIQTVIGWISTYPQATVREWQTFSTRHAQRAWEDGFRAGWEAKTYGEPLWTEEQLDQIDAHYLEGETLDRPVPIQNPEGYENVVFVDDRGTPYE